MTVTAKSPAEITTEVPSSRSDASISPSSLLSAAAADEPSATGSFEISATSVNDSDKVTSSAMVLNLIVGGLGTGMLSLPWAMAGASVAVGSLIIVLVIAVNVWTIMILVHAAERHQVFDLGALLGKLPGSLGPGMQMFTNLMVWIVLFGSLISYIIGICDSAQSFVQGTFLGSQRWALAGLASLLVLPLCFLDQRYLSFSSGAAILVNVYLMGLVVLEFVQKAQSHELPEGTCDLGFAKGSVTMISTMMQSVIIQMCVLPMYKELENRSPAKFSRVLAVAFSALALIFIVLSAAGYYAFGPTVQSNVLLSLPHNVAMDVVQAGMILVLAAVYPVMMIAMTAPLKNLPLERFGAGPVAVRRKFLAVAALTLFFVGASFVTALFVTSLGLVNVIDGALCVGVFTALAPALVGLKLLDRRTLRWRLAMGLLLFCGMVASALGFAMASVVVQPSDPAARDDDASALDIGDGLNTLVKDWIKSNETYLGEEGAKQLDMFGAADQWRIISEGPASESMDPVHIIQTRAKRSRELANTVSVMFAQRREMANEKAEAKAAPKRLFKPELADTVQAFFTRVVGCEVPASQRRTGGFGVQHQLEEDRSKLVGKVKGVDGVVEVLKNKYECLKGERYRVIGERGGPAGMWRLEGGKTIPKTHVKEGGWKWVLEEPEPEAKLAKPPPVATAPVETFVPKELRQEGHEKPQDKAPMPEEKKKQNKKKSESESEESSEDSASEERSESPKKKKVLVKRKVKTVVVKKV
ncbi:unnamed protein product [Effrenium voratum]|nr:unnamed protein product [Effrenium voratum]